MTEWEASLERELSPPVQPTLEPIEIVDKTAAGWPVLLNGDARGFALHCVERTIEQLRAPVQPTEPQAWLVRALEAIRDYDATTTSIAMAKMVAGEALVIYRNAHPAQPTEPVGDCWDAIRADKQLDAARGKLSIHELRLIILHAKRGMVEESVYLSAVQGRRDFRQAYREKRAEVDAKPQLPHENHSVAHPPVQPTEPVAMPKLWPPCWGDVLHFLRKHEAYDLMRIVQEGIDGIAALEAAHPPVQPTPARDNEPISPVGDAEVKAMLKRLDNAIVYSPKGARVPSVIHALKDAVALISKQAAQIAELQSLLETERRIARERRDELEQLRSKG